MNMKRLLSLVAFFATLQASAQQVNPVPDYVFANRMSAGRNTVTDTAAYFSIGPRYGATRGMMPPMVVDTASFSGNKRNGLLIFSVQKNKFLYWDSVGVKWAEMAGTAGTALTSADTAALLSTRAWRQKGIDSVAQFRIRWDKLFFSGAAYLSKMRSDSVISNSGLYETSTDLVFGSTTAQTGYQRTLQLHRNVGSSDVRLIFTDSTTGQTTPSGLHIYKGAQQDGFFHNYSNANVRVFTNNVERFRVTSGGETILGTSFTDNGDYVLQVAGNQYTSGGAVFGASSGNVGIGTAPSAWSGFSGVLQLKFGGHIVTSDNSFMQLGTNSFYNGSNYVRVNNGYSSRYLQNDGGHFFSSATTSTAGSTVTFNEYMRLTRDGEFWLGYTSDQGAYILQANGNALITGNIRTAAPSGGTANDWRLGTVATVTPTSPNRTIEVSIGGTIYYIHAKTTND
jgi:hypothetical protein